MTLTEAKIICKLAGNHFFDRETMRFFGSRIESKLYKNRCFITSENNFDNTERFYTVRRFSENYERVETVGDFNTIKTKTEAQRVAKEVV